jgi:hypothetical protein
MYIIALLVTNLLAFFFGWITGIARADRDYYKAINEYDEYRQVMREREMEKVLRQIDNVRVN